MKTYELTYIVSDAVADDGVAAVSLEVNKELERLGGVIMKEEPWGKRKLAYAINHRSYGTYITVEMHLDGSKIADLDRFLRLNPSVLRHLVIAALPQAIKLTDEAELTEALEKRVEDKKSKAKEKEEEVKVVAPVEAVTPEVEEEVKPKRRSKKETDATEKKAEDEDERKKAVDAKLNEILGE
jgi:small subunit ribosomal protein S6